MRPSDWLISVIYTLFPGVEDSLLWTLFELLQALKTIYYGQQGKQLGEELKCKKVWAV